MFFIVFQLHNKSVLNAITTCKKTNKKKTNQFSFNRSGTKAIQ